MSDAETLAIAGPASRLSRRAGVALIAAAVVAAVMSPTGSEARRRKNRKKAKTRDGLSMSPSCPIGYRLVKGQCLPPN